MLSIIIPTRNEAAGIESLLRSLQPLRENGHEVILVDGGSEDGTMVIAGPLVDYMLESEPGRARQMNAGAAMAKGDLFWFLHADSVIPGNAENLLASLTVHGPFVWGRFDVALSGRQRAFRVIESLMNLRSRMTGIATGDQGIFISRRLFHEVKGFPDQPLMEDIEISKALRRISKPVLYSARLVTSSRRWEQHGILRTIVKMWALRVAYFAGIPADKLVMRYD